MGWDDRVPALAVLAMPFGEQRMRLSEWIETSRIGLDCARRGGGRLLEGRLLSGLVAAYRWTGEFASASECADAALAVFEELGDRERIGVLLVNRARIHHAARDFRTAAEAFREAVAFLRDHGEAHWLATALNQLGMALARTGDGQAAVQYQLESLLITQKEQLGHYEGVVLLNLSISHIMLGQVTDADDAIERAAAAAQGRGLPMLEAEILRQTAEVRNVQGKAGEAIGLMRQALATMDELDYPEADEVRARLQGLTGEGIRRS
jgi:tetratricopeptide (TPR) repeat protein